MKIGLFTLSGPVGRAHKLLLDRWPEAEVIDLPRSILESGNMPRRLSGLRRERVHVFAVMTASLGWQYGQEALLYFGALAGARYSIILDARGESICARRASLLTRSPIRIANCYLRGRRAVRIAGGRLDTLETPDPHATVIGGKNSEAVRIAYFRTTPSSGGVPGGATSHINGVVNGLIGLGAEVTLIANDLISGLAESDVTYNLVEPVPNVMPRAAFDIYNGLRFADRASLLIEDTRPSFIYERYSRFSIAGAEASRLTGVPLFLEYNGSEVWGGRHWDGTAMLDLLERYERINLKIAARIFVVSEIERNNLLEIGLPGGKIVINPNGVDVDTFRPGRGGEHIRSELGIEKGEAVAGFLGTFGHWHGVLTLADAIALTPRNTNVKFLFIGDGRLKAETETSVQASGNLDRVIFTGSISHDRIPALLDACDILVSPHLPLADGSEFFGSPTKLFEYMAMGKGIVASRLGQIADVLSDGENALLVEPGDAGQLSDAIQRLAGDPGLRERLGNACRRKAIDHHTWKRNAERVLDTYRGFTG